MSLLDRKQFIRLAQPDAHIKERLAEAAAELNRAGTFAARAELANEALSQLIVLVYTKDDTGAVNVDTRTWRLLIPAPFGEAGWRRWGLRQHEARTLRRILLARQKEGNTEPIFIYDPECRSWLLNGHHYRSKSQALACLSAYPITAKEWRRYAEGTGRVQ
jgi:hypothetical protein